MEHDPRAYLWDVIDSASAIAQFVGGRSREEYMRDRLLRSAVERQLEIIGEALNRLSNAAPSLASRVPELAQAVALRNLIIHGYAKVNDEVIWGIVQTDVPRLHERVTALLGELGTDR